MDTRCGNFPLSCYKLSIKNTVLYYLHLHGASKGRTFELIVKKVLSVSYCGVFLLTLAENSVRSISVGHLGLAAWQPGTRPR